MTTASLVLGGAGDMGRNKNFKRGAGVFIAFRFSLHFSGIGREGFDLSIPLGLNIIWGLKTGGEFEGMTAALQKEKVGC